MTFAIERDPASGRIQKRTAIADPEPTGELTCGTNCSTAPEPAGEEPTVLQQYQQQADALASALGTVQRLHQDIAATTKTRETALAARQTLIDGWVQEENESAVEELSRVSSRGEVLQARLNWLATRLTQAEAELKTTLATFATSYNSLYWMLRSYLIDAATEQIRAMLHPSIRPTAGTTIREIAALAEPVVNLEPFAINPEVGSTMPNNTLTADNILRAAERSWPKAEPLIAEAAKHPGFQPPTPFSQERWRASLPVGVPVAA